MSAAASDDATLHALALDCASIANDGLILAQDGLSLAISVEQDDDCCTVLLDQDGERRLREWLNARHAAT